MAYSNNHIHGNVAIDDVRTALVVSPRDLGGAILAGVSQGKVNKWAKWKPMKSTNPTMSGTILHMSTNDQRKNAGRASVYDTGLVYGVRGGVAYNSDSILDLHNRSFVYEGPSGASGEVYRLSDFACPEDVSSSHQYGYKTDAKCNLTGEAFKWNANLERIYIGTQEALYVNLTYATRANNYEEINIEDFFHSSVTVANCYPCIMITTATGYTYIHCLYPYDFSITTLTKLGSNPQGMTDASWRLDLSDGTTVPSELQSSGVNWTWSVFLSSSRYLVANNAWDISGWVTVKEPGGSTPGDLFQSDLIGVPGLVGLTWQAVTNNLPFFLVDNIVANQAGNGFIVNGHYSSEYTRPDTSQPIVVTVHANLYDPSDTTFENSLGDASKTITLNGNPSAQQAGFTQFLFSTDFDMQYPGHSETYVVRSYADLAYMALTPTSGPFINGTITYSAQ